MARFAATVVIVAATCSAAATARAQPAMIGIADADPAAEVPPPPNLAPPPSATPPCATTPCSLPPCTCDCVAPVLEADDTELTAAIAVGSTVTGLATVLALVLASRQPGGPSTTDFLPVVGPIYATHRVSFDDNTGPLLLFAAGVQAIGILVVGVAASERAQERRLRIDVGAAPSGAAATLTWRY